MNREKVIKICSEKGVKLWQVAKAMYISESTLTRLLREDPIPENKAADILQAIEKVCSNE